MKLAQLILPERDNELASLRHIHADLRKSLAGRFGGFTAVKALGGWQRAQGVLEEPVIAYSIAMDRAAIIDLRQIAADVAKRARQECVMIVTPNGDVEFIKPKGE